MAITDSSLKAQVFEVETRMAKKVEDVFYAHTVTLDGIWVNVSAKELLDRLLIIYENAVSSMIQEVVKTEEYRIHNRVPTMVETAEIVKRLNKGYLRFCYDLSDERLEQYFSEKAVKDELNPPEVTIDDQGE